MHTGNHSRFVEAEHFPGKPCEGLGLGSFSGLVLDSCALTHGWMPGAHHVAREDGTWWDTVDHTCSPYTWEAEAGSCKFWVSWAHGEIMPQNLLLTDGSSSVLGVLPCRVLLGPWACMSGRLGML